MSPSSGFWPSRSTGRSEGSLRRTHFHSSLTRLAGTGRVETTSMLDSRLASCTLSRLSMPRAPARPGGWRGRSGRPDAKMIAGRGQRLEAEAAVDAGTGPRDHPRFAGLQHHHGARLRQPARAAHAPLDGAEQTRTLGAGGEGADGEQSRQGEAGGAEHCDPPEPSGRDGAVSELPTDRPRRQCARFSAI